ncbi:MAG: histone deacetylase family protein [Candidatus Hadarchaeales archaeon]
MTTALIYSQKYLEHMVGWGHPERPERLKVSTEALKKAGLWGTEENLVVEPLPAKISDITLVHTKDYIELVEKLSRSEIPIDGDTPTRKNTFQLSLLSAGGAIAAGKIVVEGKANNSFALIRPPGHHAFSDRGGGFCYFNNMAVMIRALQRDLGVKKVFVLDIDAHHGNGTQDIFYEDPGVFYMSFHQHPHTLYPGSGFPEEIGSKDGEGFTANVPMEPGSGDGEYAAAVEKVFLPICEQFAPQMIAVSIGFDAHADDPLTGLRLSSSGYGWIAQKVVEMAGKICDGKTVFLLEGGYSLKAMEEGVVNVVKALNGEKFAPPGEKSLAVIGALRKALEKWWKF